MSVRRLCTLRPWWIICEVCTKYSSTIEGHDTFR